MKKSIVIVVILVFALLTAKTQNPEAKTGIVFKETGKIKPRKASDIKSSYLSIGCEVLDRDFANYDKYKVYLGNLGVKHARFQSGWAKTEKQKGVYDFLWLDKIIDDCRARGIQPWVNTVYGNPVYEGGGDIQSSSKLPQTEEAKKAWDAYVENLITHFRDRVFEWEIWNEINHGGFKASSPEEYAEFYIRTAEIIRKLQPKGKIIALALAGSDLKFTKAFFEYLKEKGAIHLIDRVSYHGYPTNPDTGFDKSDELTELIHSYNKNILVFQGETGCPSSLGSSGALSGYPYTELSQAKWDLRRTLAHIGRGIQFSLFTLSEFNYPGNKLNTKGKLKIDENLSITHVKQSYYGYQNLTSVFDSTVVAHYPNDCKIESDSVSSVYAFGNNKGELAVVAYWNSGKIPNETVLTQKANLLLTGNAFKSPVLVDLRTGVVYEIPKSAITKQAGKIQYQLPVYDSPLLICSRKFLQERGLLK